jgi:hypothetical protein
MLNESSNTISSKDRIRLAKVRDQLAKGINPYADIKDRVLTIGSRVHVPVVTKVSKKIIKALESKWKSGDSKDLGRGKYGIRVKLGIQVIPTYTEILTCSFCGIQVHESTLTVKSVMTGYANNPNDMFGVLPRYKKMRACCDCVDKLR